MMHEHDNDLVMALAEGALDGPAAAEALDSVTACAVCFEELALQREALAALSSLTAPRLTELEAARLRRHLDDALGHSRTAAPTAPARRRLSLKPLMGIAAVLLAVAVAVPALQSLRDGSGGGDAGVAATEAATGGGDDDSSRSAFDAAGQATFAPEAAVPEEAADTELMMATTAATQAGDVSAAGNLAAEMSAYQQELAAALADAAAAPDADLAADLLADRYQVVDDDPSGCTAAIDIDGATGEVIEVGEIEVSGQRLLIEVHVTETGPAVVALDPGTCSVVAVSGP